MPPSQTKTNNKTQASIVRRFGAESAPAKAFIPSHELAAAVAQAATLPKASTSTPAAAVPTPAELEALTAWVLGESEDATGGTTGRRRLQQPSAATQTINTYVHVIDGGPGTFSNVDQSVVDAQIAVLNTAYAPYGFAFVLANTSRTLAPEWSGIDIYSASGDAAQLAMKTALRRGTAADLNLYVSSIKFGILGYSTFPDGYAELPLDDGVVLGWAYLPGADADTGNIYNLGDTTVHETGHWLGLYHTFQGKCALDPVAGGDMVADTPAEKKPNYFTCKLNRDTCKGKRYPGKDPVTNYMDYSAGALCCLHSYVACVLVGTMGRTTRPASLTHPKHCATNPRRR